MPRRHAKHLKNNARLEPKRIPNPFQINTVENKMQNGILKAPDAVSERKTDPGGVWAFESRRLGIALGSLWGALNRCGLFSFLFFYDPQIHEKGSFRKAIENTWRKRCDKSIREKWWKVKYTRCENRVTFWYVLKHVSRWKMLFAKKVHVREPHESCSIMRACVGSPKRKDINQMRTNSQEIFQKRSQKSDGTNVKKTLTNTLYKIRTSP